MTAPNTDFNTTEHDAVLGLGSNAGSETEKLAALRAACSRLADNAGIRVTARSSIYRTPPWGETNQPDFLNAAVRVATILGPDELLSAAKNIERELGRTATYRWGPRLIDIDILLYDRLTMETPLLTIPHKHLLQRDFACLPAFEAAPDAMMPDGTRLDHAASGLLNHATILRIGAL